MCYEGRGLLKVNRSWETKISLGRCMRTAATQSGLLLGFGSDFGNAHDKRSLIGAFDVESSGAAGDSAILE